MRHPLQLAIQWASLDVLSGGRTILTVCNGGSARDGALFATDLRPRRSLEERMPRLEEGITLLRQLFAPDPVTFHGRFYTFDDVDMQPKPVQAHVPICIAVNPAKDIAPALEERILRRVARLADGWQTDATIEPEVFRERWARIQAYSAEYGRAGEVADAQLHLMVNINDDTAKAHRESTDFLDHYYGQGTVAPDFLDNWLAYGPPSAVIEKIATFVEAGYTTIVLRFTSPRQQAQLERCINDVLPAFKGVIEG